MLKLSEKIIKSHIPDFIDGSRFNGVSLTENSYDLFCSIKGKEYILRTVKDNKVVEILSSHFNVKYVGRWWCHYHEYRISMD